MFKARRNALGLKQNDVGPTPKTVAAIEKGDVGPKSRSTAPYAEALGWPADAWQRLLDGADPETFTAGSPAAADAGSDLRVLLGVGGEVVEDRLRDAVDQVNQLTDAVADLASRVESLEAALPSDEPGPRAP